MTRSHRMRFAAVLALLSAGCGCGLSTDDVRRITPAELKAELEAGRAVVVDVRTTTSFSLGHITGALSMPLSQVEARADELPRDKLIATYCS